MNETDRPHLPHVPTLTEVIEVEPLHIETAEASAQTGAPGEEPPHMIVSRNLPDHDADHSWKPIKNLVLPDHPDQAAAGARQQSLELSEVPVLTEPVLTAEVVAALPVMPAELTHEQVAHRVMMDVQKRVDSMLEFRLREALAPILARHTEAIIRDLRDELSDTMRDVVSRAVTQELAKMRQR
jgi:hypothetical protein